MSDPPRTLRGMRGRNTTRDHLYTDAENQQADQLHAALTALVTAGVVDPHPYADDPYPLG